MAHLRGRRRAYVTRRRQLLAPLVACLLTTALLHRRCILAAPVPCNSTLWCETTFQPGSICHAETQTCTNPYVSGCLYQKGLNQQNRQQEQQERQSSNGTFTATATTDLEGFTVRLCNSDDGDPQSAPQCSTSRFDYPEIRVANGNWESSMFLSWIIQIFLTEMLDVPVTIETSNPDSSFNFYDEHNAFAWGSVAYDFDALREADRVVDCQKASEGKSCAHVTPEVWNGKKPDYDRAEAEGYIEPAEGNGEVGKISWYVPKFTAERDYSLVSYFGLKGEQNRQKLAETFLRPTTWGDYCNLVSLQNCTEPDDVAERYPESDSEAGSYYSAGSYTGHFRFTDDNNCTLNPTTCTGHIVDAPCTWSTFTESQLYWNNISLKSDGSQEPNGAYSYGEMIQIWNAANATQSDVMMWWWKPDYTIEQFRDTPGEFQPVMLPQPTDTCVENRVSPEDRCDPDPLANIGNPEGSCDSEAHALQRLVAASLYESTYSVADAWRSPAYEALKGFRVSDVSMDAILQSWVENSKLDMFGYDAREAVCSWVADNVDTLSRYIPPGYPRIMVENTPYGIWFTYLAQGVAILAVVAVMYSIMAVFRWKEVRVMVYPQVGFLQLMLVGFLLTSAGATIIVLQPAAASCVASEWFIIIGWTFSLVPLLCKASSMNKRNRFRRRGNSGNNQESANGSGGGGGNNSSGIANIRKKGFVQPKVLYSVTFVGVLLAGVYVAAWTVVDPPDKLETRELADERGQVVEVSLSCASNSRTWGFVAIGTKLVILLCLTILAFQARNIMLDFNESRTLATMVYCHLLFALLGLIIFSLTGKIKANVQVTLLSIFLSLDILGSLFLYYLPKFKTAHSGKDPITEAALAQELRQLIHTATTPIFGVDFKGMVNEWNDRMLESTGYTSKDALKKPFISTFVVPEHQRAVQRVIDDALLMGKASTNQQVDVFTKSHEVRHLLLNVTPRRNAEIQVVGVLIVVQDVTESTRHEKVVSAMATEITDLISTANAPIFGVDVHCCVSEWNAKTSEITGYPKQYALGKPLVENFIVPSSRRAVQDALDAALEGRQTKSYRLAFRTNKGDTRHLLVNATTRRDIEGNIVGVVGVAQDVTEAITHEREAFAVSHELHQLVDSANAPIFDVDVDLNVTEWNSKAAELTGYGKREVLGRSFVSTLVVPSVRPDVQRVLEEALMGKEMPLYEVQVQTKSKEIRYFKTNATPKRDKENNIVGVMAVAQDVTEATKLSEALKGAGEDGRSFQDAKDELSRMNSF